MKKLGLYFIFVLMQAGCMKNDWNRVITYDQHELASADTNLFRKMSNLVNCRFFSGYSSFIYPQEDFSFSDSAAGVDSPDFDRLISEINRRAKVDETIRVYPDPVVNALHLYNKSKRAVLLKVYDRRAELIIVKKTQRENEVIDFSGQKKGTYVLEIISGGQSAFKKVIKG